MIGSGIERSTGADPAPGIATRRVWLWAALVAVLVSLPSLLVGFSGDDLSQRLILEGRAPGFTASWFGVYDFTPPRMPAAALIRQGFFPWFTDPILTLRFFRPLSSATLALDNVLFGRNALLAHLHSLLWMALLAGTAGRLYQRWFSGPAALVSALVFALSGVHAIPLDWLASRHSLVAASFGALSLLGWVRFREDDYKPGIALAAVALVASLLSSEAGLVSVVLLAGYEIGTRGLRRGLRGAALPVGLGLCYLALYAALGYGPRHSGFYVSPFDSPLAYLAAVFWGVPALVAELLLGIPSLAAGFGGRPAQALLAGVGWCAAIGAAVLLRALMPVLSAGAGRVLAWLSVGSLVSLLALVGAPVSGRVLPLPLLGAAAVAGNALWGCWAMARPSNRSQSGAHGRRRWWLAFGLLALFQLGLSPLVRLSMPSQFRKSVEAQKQMALTADVGSCARGGALYLINGSDPTLTLDAGAALLFYTPEKANAAHLRVLSMAPQRHRLTRTAPSVLDLEVLDPPRKSNQFEGLFRAPSHPLQAGQSFDVGELKVQVDAASGGLFMRGRFEFDSDLDHSRSCFMVWKNGRLESLPVPRVGESVSIEHEPGPLGL